MAWNNIKLETVTPIHIGNGEEYTFLDYFLEDGAANILNVDLLFEGLKDIEVINQLSKDIEKNIVNGQVQVDVKDFFSKYDIDVSKHISKKIKTDVLPSRRVRIKKFINQKGRCYVPGSSIKGAIRTAYLFNYFDKNENIEKLMEVLENISIRDNDKSNILNKIVFGEITNDFFKYLRVEDSQFLTDCDMKIIETKKYNNKTQKKLPIYLEVLKNGSVVNFEIKICDGFKDTIENMSSSIGNLTKTICDYEIKNNKNPDFIQNFYRKILDNMKNPNEIYINIGFGGGYLPKTTYLLLWKYKKNIIKRLLPTSNDKRRGIYQRVDMFEDFPRTRTIYGDNPIGWVKLNFK